jgi:DNA-binding response OmpR family regulator
MPDHVIARNQTILVIDDEDLLVSIIQKMLGSKGFDVIFALSVEPGLRLFAEKQREIALVLLDYRLPDWTGVQVLAKLNEIDPSAKVVVMSGFLEEFERESLIEKGVKGILTKPFSMAELVETVSKAVPHSGDQGDRGA